MLRPYIFALCLVACFAEVPKEDHIVDKALSDHELELPDHDHEAYLDKEGTEESINLPPEEIKQRLGIIAAQIDKRGDGDGKISKRELKDWIKFIQTRSNHEDSDKHFGQLDVNQDGKVHWSEYKQFTYEFMDGAEHARLDDDDDNFNYEQMVARDKRRWKAACSDSDDDSCTLKGYRSFTYPKDFDHMKDIVMQETLDEIDENKDGVVELSEYVGYTHKPEKKTEDVPEWVEIREQDFMEYRDANNDGVMDLDEVRAWIFPEHEYHNEKEAIRLVDETDDDKDGELSIAEVIAHHDKFVGSKVTDWGEALTRHDEF